MRRYNGAAEGTRTPDPLITNEVLYQLSYRGRLSRRMALSENRNAIPDQVRNMLFGTTHQHKTDWAPE
jgi:hypothetical protein